MLFAIVTTEPDGWLAASSGSPAGVGAVAVTNNGTSIVNSFLARDYAGIDSDADGEDDMAELVQAESAFVLASRPTLTMTGECPGPVTFHAAHFDPGSTVSMLTGRFLGNAATASGTCAGTETGMRSIERELGTRVADADGAIEIAVTLSDKACGTMLQFLQTDNIGLTGGQPVGHVVEACPEAVDVPGGDTHAGDSSPYVQIAMLPQMPPICSARLITP